ncbi:hypothetical protein BsWGS_23351 [Bradybaena similaris]
MGCGKSRHHSPGDSETDLKNSGSYNYNKTSSKHNPGKNAKKKVLTGDEKRNTDKTTDKETEERSPSLRKISNGKTRIKDRDEEIGFHDGCSPGNQSLGASSSSSVDGTERTNCATKTHNKNYLLEVPNEISKTTHQTRTTCKDFKTITTAKGVHITTSQLEFFKMLDEKIEKGCDYQTSNEASEASSIEEVYKQ